MRTQVSGLLAVLVMSSSAMAAPCYSDGQQGVKLTGSVNIENIKPDADGPPKGYHYPLLTLAAAVCVTPEGGGPAISTKKLAILSASGKTPAVKIGNHVSVTGQIGTPPAGLATPPEDLVLMILP